MPSVALSCSLLKLCCLRMGSDCEDRTIFGKLMESRKYHRFLIAFAMRFLETVSSGGSYSNSKVKP